MEIKLRHNSDYSKVDTKIEEIINSEDRIHELNLNLTKKIATHETSLNDLNNDINQNYDRIDLLKQFTINEEIQIAKEIKKREDEKNHIDYLIKELEEEIFKFEIFNRKLFAEEENSTGKTLEKIFSSDFTNELRENKKELKKLNEKKMRIFSKIKDYQNSISELNETIQMLEEERDVTENELVNLISHKESLEEMINFNNFSLFKNVPLNSSIETFNSSIYLVKVIEILPQEIYEINNINKFSRNLYENLTEFISNDLRLIRDSISSNKLQNENFKTFEIKINFSFFEKYEFDNLVKKYISTYKESKGLYNVDDFFILLTKKVYDYMVQSAQSNDKNCIFIIKEINIERLRFYFKYFFKINYYDNLIAGKIKFLNKEYKKIKRDNINKIEELEKRLADLNFSLDKIDSRETQLKEKIESKTHIDKTENNREDLLKLNSLRELDYKVNSLIELKNELNCDIFNLTSKHKKNVRDYEEKIKELETINDEMKRKQTQILSENNFLKIKTNEDILKIRNLISEKYKEIKDYIRKENEKGNDEIIEYMKKCLSEKRESINFPSNIFNLNDILTNRNISRTVDNFNKSDIFTSKNQTFISAKLNSHTQSFLNNPKSSTNQNSRLDFIRTLDHSRLNDRTPSHSPLKNLYTNRSTKKDTELLKADYSFKSREIYNNKTDYSIISLEDSQSNEINNHTSSYYKYDHYNERESKIASHRSKEPKARSIDSRHKLFTQKMKEDQKIKIHIEALKSEINRNCFGMIGDIEKNKKLNPLAEGSLCLKRTYDFSQSQRYFENDNSNMNNYEYNLYKHGFKRYKIYLDKLKNKIIFTLDKSQAVKISMNSQYDRSDNFSNSTLSYKSQSNSEEIALTEIEKTIVSKNMKKVIEVQQAIKKMQRNLKNDLNYESGTPHKLTKNDDNKNNCRYLDKKNSQESKTKYFNMIIQLVNGSKIEIFLFSYDEYKAWLNGLAYVIKNYPKKLT